MRILFDSQQTMFKEPFGTLVPEQTCTLHIHIPNSVGALEAECILCADDGGRELRIPMSLEARMGAYDVFKGTFALKNTGLYFYYFTVTKKDSCFRLFKQGHDTNMEAGDLWQLSCVPADFTTPDWAKGATIYQVFPDRFRKCGSCDLTGKLQPYITASLLMSIFLVCLTGIYVVWYHIQASSD